MDVSDGNLGGGWTVLDMTTAHSHRNEKGILYSRSLNTKTGF